MTSLFQEDGSVSTSGGGDSDSNKKSRRSQRQQQQQPGNAHRGLKGQPSPPPRQEDDMSSVSSLATNESHMLEQEQLQHQQQHDISFRTSSSCATTTTTISTSSLRLRSSTMSSKNKVVQPPHSQRRSLPVMSSSPPSRSTLKHHHRPLVVSTQPKKKHLPQQQQQQKQPVLLSAQQQATQSGSHHHSATARILSSNSFSSSSPPTHSHHRSHRQQPYDDDNEKKDDGNEKKDDGNEKKDDDDGNEKKDYSRGAPLYDHSSNSNNSSWQDYLWNVFYNAHFLFLVGVVAVPWCVPRQFVQGFLATKSFVAALSLYLPFASTMAVIFQHKLSVRNSTSSTTTAVATNDSDNASKATVQKSGQQQQDHGSKDRYIRPISASSGGNAHIFHSRARNHRALLVPSIKEEETMEEEMLDWLRFWMIRACLEALKALSTVAAGVLPFSFVMAMKMKSVWRLHAELIFYCWLYWVPFLQDQLAQQQQRQQQQGDDCAMETKTASVFQKRPLRLLCQHVGPQMRRIVDMASDVIPAESWQNNVVALVSQVANALVLIKAVDQGTCDQIIHVTLEGRTLVVPSLTLFLPGFLAHFGVVYVKYVLSVAKSYAGEKGGTAVMTLGQNHTTASVTALWLKYWVLHAFIDGILSYVAPLLWWIPFSSHCLFVFWYYMSLPHAIEAWYSDMVRELVQFGVFSAIAGCDEEYNSSGIEESRTAKFLGHIWQMLPKAADAEPLPDGDTFTTTLQRQTNNPTGEGNNDEDAAIDSMPAPATGGPETIEEDEEDDDLDDIFLDQASLKGSVAAAAFTDFKKSATISTGQTPLVVAPKPSTAPAGAANGKKAAKKRSVNLKKLDKNPIAIPIKYAAMPSAAATFTSLKLAETHREAILTPRRTASLSASALSKAIRESRGDDTAKAEAVANNTNSTVVSISKETCGVMEEKEEGQEEEICATQESGADDTAKMVTVVNSTTVSLSKGNDGVTEEEEEKEVICNSDHKQEAEIAGSLWENMADDDGWITADATVDTPPAPRLEEKLDAPSSTGSTEYHKEMMEISCMDNDDDYGQMVSTTHKRLHDTIC